MRETPNDATSPPLRSRLSCDTGLPCETVSLSSHWWRCASWWPCCSSSTAPRAPTSAAWRRSASSCPASASRSATRGRSRSPRWNWRRRRCSRWASRCARSRRTWPSRPRWASRSCTGPTAGSSWARAATAWSTARSCKSRHQAPVLGIEAHGSAGGSDGPRCSSSIEMRSGERTKAMWPSRGGRLIVTPASSMRWHTA